MTADAATSKSKPGNVKAFLQWAGDRFRALGRGLSAVGQALLAAGGDIAFALALAAIAFLIADALKGTSYVRSSGLAEHLGIAFVVAAIAVFGYEYKSRRAAQLIARLFAGDDEYLVSLRRSWRDALTATREVVQSNVPHRDLAVGMIEALLQSVTKNANAFQDRSYFEIVCPRPAELIDKMLATRMADLGQHGTYDVVSDFASFQHRQLPESIAAMRACVSKGARVRRVFFCFTHDRDLPIVELEKIAREHWELSCELGGKYDARFAKPIRLPVEPKHEGIFTTGGRSVGFEVLEPELRRVRFHSEPEAALPAYFERLLNESLKAEAEASATAAFDKYLTSLRKQWRKASP